jgi:mono/diheme cytochrome c family protein
VDHTDVSPSSEESVTKLHAVHFPKLGQSEVLTMKRQQRLSDVVRAARRCRKTTRPSAVPKGSLIARHVAVIAPLVLILLAAGCQQQYSGPLPKDDAAMKRASQEGKTPEQAAQDYFLPKKLVDYFPAMDTVGAAVDKANDWPDQLLDKPWPGAKAGAKPKREVHPLKLTTQEGFGRNAWMIWCAGNEGFWDWLANNSYGSSDVLKLVDSRNRGTLFRDAGLINEPEMVAPGSPEPTDFKLWMSVPTDLKRRQDRATYLKQAFDAILAGTFKVGYQTSPTAGKSGYYASTGTAHGSGEEKEPPPEIYGLSSGVIGLRLFPNPEFRGQARSRWDAQRYYNDPDYYSDPKLVRPFTLGMSCAFCHASFHPLNPPRDITNPRWENLSGNIGAQYLRIRAIFANLMKPRSFVYHVLDSQPPGTIDTSLIPSDNINNTNAMNAIFRLPDRAVLSFKNPKEKLAPTSAAVPSIYTDQEIADGQVPPGILEAIPELPTSNGNPRRVPRVLFDGADSVGLRTALARVYLNIGSYWEQWLTLHDPLVGFRPQLPFRIDDCKAHSVYWNATQLRISPLRDYFLKITPPMRLTDVQDGIDRTAPIDEVALRSQARREGLDYSKLLATERAKRIDTSKLKKGREVFARNCIICHSSKQPPERFEAFERESAGGEFWDHDPGRWLSDPAYQKWALAEVEKSEFWADNYLSTDYRIPINLVRTNSARAMATNAMTDHMWSDFSSESYQSMPSVGAVTYFNPFLGESGGDDTYTPRHKSPKDLPGGGGPGFYRVPTLLSIWTSAPLLHNNSLGLFNNDPSVDGRLLAFDDAIRKLLWLEKRLESSSYNEATPERLKKDHGLIWRTPVETHLTLGAKVVPGILLSRVTYLMYLGEWIPFVNDRRLLLLPAGLLVVSYFALLRLRRGWIRFWLGYITLVLALLTFALIAFLNGRVGDFHIGPIPKGTPVNLLASINPDAERADLLHALSVTTQTLSEAESMHLSDAEKISLLNEKVAPALMKVSRCPDFVMDQGHYYEWFKTMTDADKEALIELLKTF